MRGDDGAFQDGEGRAPRKERAREPDHRMWAIRTLCLKEGKDGTGGEDDYQVSAPCSKADRDSYSRRCMMITRSLEGRPSCVS